MKNDVSLADIMSRLDRMDSGIKKELQGINVRINRLEERVGKIESRLGSVEKRLDSVEKDVSGIKVRLGSVEKRLDSVEFAVKENKRCIEDNTNLLVKFSHDVKERFDDISTVIRMLTGHLNKTHDIAIDNSDNIRKLKNARY